LDLVQIRIWTLSDLDGFLWRLWRFGGVCL
jgi:hypothetical protein